MSEQPKIKAATLFDDSSEYNENDKVVCVDCTNQFFEIYFTDVPKNTEDPVLQDILSKKVYMKLVAEHNCYICPQCGKVELIKDTLVHEPEKKLTVAGIENFADYRKITGSVGGFTRGTNVNHKNREDIIF